MTFIGIDPGASGGIGIISTDGNFAIKFGDKTESDIWNELQPLAADYVAGVFAVIEDVHSMPKQGVSSSFKFGKHYGFLRGLLVASGIAFEPVTPQRWQKAIGCMSRGDKNVTKQKAQQLFPHIKFTHATADAMLLAEYARRSYSSRIGVAA